MKTTPPVCDYEGSDYQKSFWDQGGRAYEDGCEAIALSRLLPAAGKRMLETGAGAGRNSPRYSGFEQVWLVDYSLSQLEQARDRLGIGGKYRYFAADIYQMPFQPGTFDAATMIRTLHHMAEPVQALAQVRACLAPGAVFILEYANKRNLKAIFRYLSKRQSWSPYSREPVEFAPLNFNFHPRAVRSWLETLGFKLERELTVSHFRSNLLKKLIPTRLLVGLDAAAQLSGDAWQLSPSVFTRSRTGGQAPEKLPETDLFRCPACLAPLTDSSEPYHCPACSQDYPTTDGIIDFRVKKWPN